jgi:hypothetical protein
MHGRGIVVSGAAQAALFMKPCAAGGAGKHRIRSNLESRVKKNGTLIQGAAWAITGLSLTAADWQPISQRVFCLPASTGRRDSSHITLIMPNASATPMPINQLKYHITNSC